MSAPVLRVRVGWAAVLLVVAALGLSAVYAGPLVPVLVVAAVVLPFLLVWGGVRLGQGSFLPAMLVVVLAAGGAWLTLGGSLGDALPRLLTSARPVPADARLLTPALVLVALVSALVAASVLATGAPAGRVTGLVAPVLGAVVLYVAGALLSAGGSDPRGVVAACLLAVVVAGWSTALVRGEALRPVVRRPLAVAPLALAVLLAFGVSVLVGGSAFDPGRHVRPPTVTLEAASPLTQFTSWQANPGVEVFRTHAVGTDRLHLATLSRFTGATWEVDGRYRQVGLHDDPDLPSGAVSTTVRATVQVTRLGSVWLPSAGTATAVSAGDAVVDSDDGTLAVASGVPAALRYDLTARVAAPSTRDLEVAGPATGVPARYLELPGAPPAFATYARKAVVGASSPLEEAVALEHAVATDRRVSTAAPSGLSYSRLSTFLFGAAGVPGAGEGSSEQFAGAFALLAREVGLPARLVVGFRLPAAAASGTSVVYGGDAQVWPEVYFAGAGWVPFSPVPGGGGTDAGVRDTVLQKVADNAARAVLPAPVRPSAAPSVSASPSATATATARPAGGGTPLWAVPVGAVAVVLALLAVVVLALRRVRTARHRRRGPAGTWAEFTDLLVLLDRRPHAHETAPDVAAAFDRSFPQAGARAEVLARAADRAGFAPDPMPDQPQLWRDLRVLRRRARTSVPLRRRVLWPVDPRPLLRRR